MHAWRCLRPVAAALCLGAALAGTAQAGPVEDELWTCMNDLMRQIPSWGGMRNARVEMQQKGFRVVSKEREAYPFRGRTIVAYAFQITGDNKTYSIRCTDDVIRSASPGAASAQFAQPAQPGFGQPRAQYVQPLGGQFAQPSAQPAQPELAQPTGRRAKVKTTGRAQRTSVPGQQASPSVAAQ